MIINGYKIEPFADLSGANLKGASLRGASLRGADLSYANLSDADLSIANLRGTDLSGADLSYANLSDADLSIANLRGTDLSGANLRHAGLRHAGLSYAHLRGTNLSGADLRYANLRHADLSNANLKGAKLPHYKIIPDEGSFIAYKKLANDIVAKILIPTDAMRCSTLIGRKCRAEKVVVLELKNKDGLVRRTSAYGWRNRIAIYEVDKETKADFFIKDIRIECTHGIHFFVTEDEAWEW